jgi:prepilin-type N-terminal cleavage/methylation domain-containing protein
MADVMRNRIETKRFGFTLIELLVVIAIIGLLISLILVAAADGVRRAEERATQALITKLETALNDRIDALLNTTAPINQTHRFLASINSNQGGFVQPVGSSTSNPDDRRAQVIAQFDYIRAELPDVFFVNALTSEGGSAAASAYPLNFAGAPYPAGLNTLASSSVPDGGSWVLPLGNNYPGLPLVPGPSTAITQPKLPTTGMMGASFSAAGGIYKNLGYAPQGYDGVDNDNNGLIDDILESGTTAAAVGALLAHHTHKTARAEMLYAVLVNGLSPLGSVFSPDDFTGKEVQDTDGDGLPEFIDAWGEPLQFFRWPIYYGSPGVVPALGTSDSQLGSAQYSGGPSQTRQQDPLDPNQLLVSPGWWWKTANPSLPLGQFNTNFAPPGSGSTNISSPGAIAFMNYFHLLVDPNPGSTGGASWDRGGNFSRREYFTKFLILSAGPDREPGVAQFGKDYSLLVDSSQIALPNSPYMIGDGTGNPCSASRTIEQNALTLIYVENQAAVADPVWRLQLSGGASGSFWEIPAPPSTSTAVTVTPYLGGSTNSDDITNHNISGISTGVR